MLSSVDKYNVVKIQSDLEVATHAFYMYIIRSSLVAHFTSASLVYFNYDIGSCAHVKVMSGPTNLLRNSSAIHV